MGLVETESPTLAGRFVTLEPMGMDHAEAMWRIAQHDEIWAYMPSRPWSLDDMQQMVEGYLQPAYLETNKPFVIRENASGEIVGSTQILDIAWAHRGAETGSTWLAPRVWRSAVNTECKLLLLTYCFETLGFIRVQLKTDARNLRSQAAIERIGGVREGVLRKHRILHDGFIRDSVYFSIIDTEWPSAKQRLVDRLTERAEY